MKKYRLIVFDMDGTMYELSDVVKQNYEVQVDFFSKEKNISKEETMEEFNKRNILSFPSPYAKSATEFFLKCGIDSEKWRKYRELHYSPCDIDKSKAVAVETIVEFSGYCDIVILSSNTENNIKSTLNWIGVAPNLFQGIYCATSDIGISPFSKVSAFVRILHDFSLNPENVLSIGDRFATDIEPLLRLGGDGVLINTPKDLPLILESLQEYDLVEQTSDSYMFYCGERYVRNNI